VKTTAGAIGIDLGGTNLKLALLDGENCIVARRTVPTQGAAGHDAVLERMIDGVRELVAAQPEIDVTGVGIGVPGDVDMVTGITGDCPTCLDAGAMCRSGRRWPKRPDCRSRDQ
jgi:glucokinase